MNLQAFPRPVGEVGLGAFSEEGPVVTLDDLLQLEIRPTWDEAVAVIEELCVAAQGLVMRPIPGGKDIILNANGTVTIRQTAAGVPDPVEAARRLHEMLAGAVAPAPLRLFVSQAVSSGTYGTLAEFEEALAYFAKPGRQERVKAVYQQAAQRIGTRVSSAEELRSSADPASPRSSDTSFFRLGAAYRPLMLAGLAVVGLAALAVALGFLVQSGLVTFPIGAPAQTSAPTPAATENRDTGDAGHATAEAVAEQAPRTADERTASATRAADPAPATQPRSALDVVRMPLTGSAAAIRYRAPRPGVESRQGSRPFGDTFDASTRSAFSLPPVTEPRADALLVQPGRLPDPIRTPPSSGPAATVPFPAAPVGDPSILYSAADTSVRPAVLAKPQLLPPPYGDGRGKPVRLEVIVAPDGTVERVRFLQAPQRMADMMILSSAKTWQFTPAMKDGHPVRYRTVLSWIAAP